MTTSAAPAEAVASTFRVDETVRQRYRAFIERCKAPEAHFRLTERADSSPYALCFAIFGLHLLRDEHEIDRHRTQWDALLRQGVRAMRHERSGLVDLATDKTYLQLLTFTLSALAVLGTLQREPLAGDVVAVLPKNIDTGLQVAASLAGAPGSGNRAMVLAILLLHARDYLSIDTQRLLDRWVELHLEHMNRFGFWGNAPGMSHLQFQNGYHQYEIFAYLRVASAPWGTAAAQVASLADTYGHFAPYLGGGGCYDYDATFMLTEDANTAARHGALLLRTGRSILTEQNVDGGFCESLCVRPRIGNLNRGIAHVVAGRGYARYERLRCFLTLLRPKHNRIHTHWSRYSRGWSESDLWDSWFRMLALARIEMAFDESAARRWGFIQYPGIGYHSALAR